MPTIAEILAAKKRSSQTLGKPKPRSLVLSTDKPEEQKNPLHETYPPAWLEQEPRSLGGAKGETIPLTPVHADKKTATWHEALSCFETELAVIQDQDEPEVCWLAVTRQNLPPILLHRLPLAFIPARHTPTDTEPF